MNSYYKTKLTMREYSYIRPSRMNIHSSNHELVLLLWKCVTTGLSCNTVIVGVILEKTEIVNIIKQHTHYIGYEETDSEEGREGALT